MVVHFSHSYSVSITNSKIDRDWIFYGLYIFKTIVADILLQESVSNSKMAFYRIGSTQTFCPKPQVFTFRLPPGPYGFPFLGVAHRITPGNLTQTLGSWRDQYGDIYSFCLAGQNIVVVCMNIVHFLLQ